MLAAVLASGAGLYRHCFPVGVRVELVLLLGGQRLVLARASTRGTSRIEATAPGNTPAAVVSTFAISLAHRQWESRPTTPATVARRAP